MRNFDTQKNDEFRNLGHKVSDFLKTRKGKLLPEEENEIPAILNSMDKDLFHFRNEELFKEGGEKVIWRAFDTRTDRHVAIARPRNTSSVSEKEAFLREARVTSKLQHPNILPVYQIGLDEDEVPYFVMRLLRGEDLRTVIDGVFSTSSGKTSTMEELLGIFLKLCDAMIYAHSMAVLHLDIKPANVMIGRFGQVHLLDWGLSVVKDDGKGGLDPDLLNSVACTGSMKGTPGYMAPEQLSGLGDESVATDIYSLGAVLYFMLTGTIPVRGKDAAEVQNNARSGRVVPPQKRRPNLTIPDSLNAVAMKALSLNPDDRYASVQDLYDDVSRYLRGFAPLAENAGPMKRLQLLVKRYNQVSTALLLAGLVLITVIGFSYQRERLQSKKLEIARTEAISNLERYRAEQEVSETLYRQMLGFTGNVAAFSDVLAFEQAYQFMENELQKDDLATEYRNRLLWNKTQLELANQQFHTAMESIKDCELDRNGSVYDFAKKYAALKPNDEDLLKEEQFAEFLSDDKNSILSRRFKAILLSLAFDLDAARRDAPDPHAYLKVILAQLNQLNNTPGWGKHIALEKVEGGYHLDLRDSPYIRYRLARMAPTPLLDKLQLVSLDLSRNEFRLEDGAAFAGEMDTLVLLDVRTYAVPRLVSALRKIPAKRMVFRKGFLTEGQVRNLGRVHEVIELPEGAQWNLK